MLFQSARTKLSQIQINTLDGFHTPLLSPGPNFCHSMLQELVVNSLHSHLVELAQVWDTGHAEGVQLAPLEVAPSVVQLKGTCLARAPEKGDEAVGYCASFRKVTRLQLHLRGRTFWVWKGVLIGLLQSAMMNCSLQSMGRVCHSQETENLMAYCNSSDN